MTVSFHKLRNGSFSLSYYARRDQPPDVARDWEFIEDAAFCIAEAMKTEPTFGPVTLVYYDRRPKGSVAMGAPARATYEDFPSNEYALRRAFERMGDSDFVDPMIVEKIDDDSLRQRSPSVLWETKALRREYERSKREDFEIKALTGGEFGISALTERAQKAYRLKADHCLVFKTRSELVPYVQSAESRGFRFKGKEILEGFQGTRV